MKPRHPTTHQIELRLVTLSQLFNSMDPTPFHHRDLDRDAVEFLESWALEFPQGSHFRIIVHIEKMPPDDPASLVTEAMHNYFEYESTLAKRSVRLLLSEGRTSLFIGLAFLAVCLVGADLLTLFTTNTFFRILKESLLIAGWVAMWRPLQIFLYDWWPVMRRYRIYRNLGCARVQVLPAKS
jgi:hypothetical protein